MNQVTDRPSVLRRRFYALSVAKCRSRVSRIQQLTTHTAIASVTLMLAVLFASPSARAQAYTETLVHIFTTPPDGDYPYAGLIAGSAGKLYGTTVAGATGFGTVFAIDKAGNETVLYTFSGTPDGVNPGVLIQGSDGELYGTTTGGGAYGYGTVFKIDIAGNETVLYNFAGGTDGQMPNGTLVQDAAGNLYGVTVTGGAFGYGTVFKLTPNHLKTTLHSFAGMPDGSDPYGGLVRDATGNLYGTTYLGGPNTNCGSLSSGCGTVFKINTSGKESVLYSFDTGHGCGPLGNLVRDAAGNLYGTTQECGASIYGTVFKLSPAGVETVLYSFVGDTDGELPAAGLVRDTTGNLYGTTAMGGNEGSCYGGFYYSGCGTVFKISPAGNEIVLLRFNGPLGASPYGSLIRDPAGKIYGTTSGGGAMTCNDPYGCGVVFELTP